MNFNFLGKAKYALALSGILVLASIVAMVTVGLRPGIDFTSGIQLVIFYPLEPSSPTTPCGPRWPRFSPPPAPRRLRSTSRP